MNVDVAVIPAAGRGTRMRPATRAVPKAFLPVVDRPAIQWIIEEGMRAGAHEFVVVVDPGVDELLRRHMTVEEGLEGFEDVTVHPVVQQPPRGLGDAVFQARGPVAGRPFFCMLVDNLVLPGEHVLAPMAQAADGLSVVCLRALEAVGLERYGVIVPGDWRSERVVEVRSAVEKPGTDQAPSSLGLVGRYLFTPEIFDHLEGLEPGYGHEVQLTDAIAALAVAGGCLGFVAERDLLDVGNPAGYLEAVTALGLSHPELGPAYRDFLKATLERR